MKTLSVVLAMVLLVFPVMAQSPIQAGVFCGTLVGSGAVLVLVNGGQYRIPVDCGRES